MSRSSRRRWRVSLQILDQKLPAMAEIASESTAVPVKVPEPQDDAPPTLAEPASGPVAEMSGALPSDGKEAAPTTANGEENQNDKISTVLIQ